MPHARCVVLIEACEESGSFDLPAYVEHLAPRIGTPSLVVCLDSGCGNYDQLWVTTSLRGLIVRHSHGRGARAKACTPATPRGIVPSSFRILRSCSSAIEDETTGEILPPRASTSRSPPSASSRRRHGRRCSATQVYAKFPFVPGMRPMHRRSDRADPEPHVAAGAIDHRRWTACRRSPARATCCGPRRR